MTTLVIDSATDACSVALVGNGEVLAGEFRKLGRGHAESLVPMIEALPGKGRAGRIAVALGPGSFTGVRVGLAAARALALAWNAELIGYPTLALIAAQAQNSRERDTGSDRPPVAVVNTGGHGEWFVQEFGTDGLPVTELASLRPDDAAKATTAQFIAGSQAEALVALRGHGSAHVLLPDAHAFGLLPPDLLSTSIAPLYGRPPDAKLPGKSSAARGLA